MTGNPRGQEIKWVSIPLPDGTTDEVYAAVTEDLTDEEKRAFGEYVAWFRDRHTEPTCPACGGTREHRALLPSGRPHPYIGNWHGPPGPPCHNDDFHDSDA